MTLPSCQRASQPDREFQARNALAQHITNQKGYVMIRFLCGITILYLRASACCWPRAPLCHFCACRNAGPAAISSRSHA